MKKSRKPADANRRAFAVVQEAVSEEQPQPVRGQAGGLVGGKARRDRLTPEERADIARVAAEARWKKGDP